MSPAIADTLLVHLHERGLEPRIYEPSLYLSIPEHAELTVAGEPIPARAAAFARSTGGAPVEGILASADPENDAPLTGRIALVDGALSPGTAYLVERRGAVAQIYIEATRDLPARSCSTIWGAPTHETIARKPRTPVVMVARSAGDRLRQAAADAEIVRLATVLREGWTETVLPVVEIQGVHHAEEFVLVHGSDDDALVALAERLHAMRGELARSVRIAWWPDRRYGTSAGSTWYADAFAPEVDEWCVAHVNVGGEPAGDAFWMAEAAELCVESIAAATGSGAEAIKGRRPSRAADYSFNQIGVTGLFGGRRLPVDAYFAALDRIIGAQLYPFDYVAPVLEMGAAVQRYQAAAEGALDLREVSQGLARLRRAIGSWRSDAETAITRHPSDIELRQRLNMTLRRLARVLVSLGYARGERFEHDPAVAYSAVPRLEAALHVSEAAEPTRAFVQIALRRQTNIALAAIRSALALVT